MRDANGAIVSGSADAQVSYSVGVKTAITAMHIHKGASGANGSIVVPFALTRFDAEGKGRIPAAQTQFPSSAVTLDTINAILADPTQFYYNVHSAEVPGGFMRGQLQRAEVAVRLAQLAPQFEVPANAGPSWTATGTVMLLITRDAANAPQTAYAIFDVAYRGFDADTTFTGLHVHRGAALTNGPVLLDSGLSGEVTGAASGILRYENELDLSAAGVADAVAGFVSNPAGYYLNLHTTERRGGAIRGQLRSTDRIDYQVTLKGDQEVPPLSATAQAPSLVSVYSIRDRAGAIAGAAVVFDENPRLASSNITATHIHDGAAGANGPVTIDARLSSAPQLTAEGTGNIWRLVTVAEGNGITTLNSMLTTPWKHYLNVHTSANPGGAVRAQLLAEAKNPPVITSIVSAAPFNSVAAVAPGSNFVLTGTGLATAASDLAGYNAPASVPTSLNGVSMTIGGVKVPLTSVSATQITGQIPFEVGAGQRTVFVTNSAGTSTGYSLAVSSVAPAILYGQQGVLATRVSNGSAVTQASPAAAGEIVAITVIGLGATTPALSTGAVLASDVQVSAADVLARVGGVASPALSITALSGTPGLYRVTFAIPQGAATGNCPMLLVAGSATSNVVSIPLK